MFGNNKYPVLTATFCTKMEMLRLAIEVALDYRTRITSLDLNTGKGTVRLGLGFNATVMVDNHFEPDTAGFYHFALDEQDNRFEAKFNKTCEKVQARSMIINTLRKHDGAILWRAGTVFGERWVETIDSTRITAPDPDEEDPPGND